MAAALLLASAMTIPSAGAGLVSVTAPLALLPPAIVVDVTVNDAIDGGRIATVRMPRPSYAYRIPFCCAR